MAATVDGDFSTPLLGWIALQLCRALTVMWSLFLGAASLVAPAVDRAPRRIQRSAKLLSAAEDGSIAGLESLPPVPPLPPHIGSVAFAGCANLSLYLAGAAYALQCAPGCAERLRSGKLKVRGGSSGAFVGVVLASGGDCAELMRLSRQRFHRQRKRLGGCLGIYASEIRQILTATLAHARSQSSRSPSPAAAGGRRSRSPRAARPTSVGAAGSDDQVVLCANRTLEVDVTCFAPAPTTTTVCKFVDEKELLDTVLCSCYIPLAYETPLRLKNLGFCIDGCALSFLPQADAVLSPYHCHAADVFPREEYPRALVFNLQHADDTLVLFEEGYLDALRWLEAGAPSRRDERAQMAKAPLASGRTLLREGVRVLLELCGF